MLSYILKKDNNPTRMELKEKHRKYYTPPECVRYHMLAEKMLGGNSPSSFSEGAGETGDNRNQTDLAKPNSFTNSQSHSEHDPWNLWDEE